MTGQGRQGERHRFTLAPGVDDGAAAIPSVISVLERGGLRVASATIARPSLDDVYLRHAGRSFQQADTDTRSHDSARR